MPHLALCVLAVAATFALAATPALAQSTGSQDMYRLYNPNSGEHFYTSSTAERDYLDAIGWNYEGVGWVAPVSSDTPVYRLYNPNVDPATGSGEHHYTMSTAERDNLIGLGWQDEGIGWYSSDAQGVPVWRQYNPYAFSNNHNYTANGSESDYLVSEGWRYEAIGWYAVSAPNASDATVTEFDYKRYMSYQLKAKGKVLDGQVIDYASFGYETDKILQAAVGSYAPGKFTVEARYELNKNTLAITDWLTGQAI